MIRAILNGTWLVLPPLLILSLVCRCRFHVLRCRRRFCNLAYWADKDGYDRQARDLARRFNENFKKYESGVSEAVRAVAPKA